MENGTAVGENIEHRKVGEVESSERHLDDEPWIKIEHIHDLVHIRVEK